MAGGGQGSIAAAVRGKGLGKNMPGGRKTTRLIQESILKNEHLGMTFHGKKEALRGERKGATLSGTRRAPSKRSSF